MAWFDEETNEVKESISRENFESWLGEAGEEWLLTDDQWVQVALEVENAINNAVERLQETLVQNIIEQGDDYFE